MISHLCIIHQGENPASQSASADPSFSGQKTHIIVNHREIYKHFGAPWEIISHFIEHLISMPEVLTVDFTISGNETAIALLNNLVNILNSGNSFFTRLISLTPGEIEILDFLNIGMSEKQIADKKSVTPQTIANACCAMHKKFHCHKNGEMIAAARRLRLIN